MRAMQSCYRESRQALAAAGAVIFRLDGTVLMAGTSLPAGAHA